MKLALALVFALCIIALASAKDHIKHKKEFAKWKNQHGKHYKTHAEHKHRFKIFKDNFDFILAHDAKAKGFTVALNEFADQTGEEFRAWGNGMNITAAVLPAIRLAEDLDLPATVDWRRKGAVTPVKNQGQCGSCWSFSATGSTEGAAFIKTGLLPNLSEQNLVDCSTAEGNMGCNGGLMDNAFKYIIENGGIDSEQSYPYSASGPNRCRYNPANSKNTLSSFHDIPQGDEKSLQEAVAKTPTSVAIDASQQSFQFYSGGVYYESQCSSTQLDHGVLAVGYGTYKSKDYWLVKNSWGASWGLNGYIMMARGRNNNCGIATSASYPIV